MNDVGDGDSLRLVQEMLEGLERWLEQNGWAGYDPYDIRALPWMLSLGARRQRKPYAVLEHLIDRSLALFPRLSRGLLCVKPQINAKAMGLLGRAYLIRYSVTGNQAYQAKADECMEWLLHNVSQGYAGNAWGYPFDWASRVLIPSGTPSAVVSCIVGDAFREAWLLNGSRRYLDICRSISDFLTNDLIRTVNERDSICFSYTPIDTFQVHNANLMTAEFLAWTGRRLNNLELLDLGARAGRFALDEQNQDGSLEYWARAQMTRAGQMDHYHAGFEMRAMYGLWKHTKDDAFLEGVRRYYTFYRANYLESHPDGVIPRYHPNRTWPVDIHSCAEALILNVTLAPDFPEAGQLLHHLVKWISTNMQTPDGWFIYRLWNRRLLPRTESMPYIRWGQAWMMLALAVSQRYLDRQTVRESVE